MTFEQLERTFRTNVETFSSRGQLFFDVDALNDLSLNEEYTRVKLSRRLSRYLEVQSRGHWLPLCSPVDPVKEAEAVFESCLTTTDIDEVDTFIVIGFEAGYLLEAVAGRCRPRSRVIVWEPFSKHLKAGFATRPIDLDKHFSLEVYLGPDARGIASLIASSIDPFTIRGLRILCNPRVATLYRTEAAEFSAELRARTSAQQLMLGTTIRHGETFFRNFLANIPFLLNTIKLDELGGQIRGRDCLLVSAGPSLEKQLDKIHAIQRRMPILCVGPAWKTLRAVGIRPDLVFSIDPFRDNFTHFEGLESEGEILVSDLANNHDVVNSFRGTISFFHTNIETGNFAKKLGFETPFLNCGGSVAHTAFSFCTRYTAKSVILVGQDLAYTGGISHATGHTGRSFLDHDRKKNPERFLEVTAYGGEGRVWTNIQMDAYRVWFESQVNVTSVVNSTEGGARINGFPEESLGAVLERVSSLCFELTVEAQLSLSNGSGLGKRLTRIRRELWTLKEHFGKMHTVMSKLIAGASASDATALERDYNELALNIPKHSASTERLLEAFSIDERFRTKRRLAVYEGQKTEHYQTNAALHQRLVASCDRAIQVLGLLQNRLNGSSS